MRKIALNWLKTGVFGVLALVSVVSLYFYEGGGADKIDVVADSFVDAVEKGNLQVVLKEGVGEKGLEDFTYSVEDGVYALDVDENFGMLFNGRYGDVEVAFDFDKVKLKPGRAIFDLEFENDRLEMLVFFGNVNLSFYDGGEMLGDFYVPQGRKVVIPYAKVDGDLALLLRRKLEKELRYSVIAEKDRGEVDLGSVLLFGEGVKQELRDGYLDSDFDLSNGFVSSLGDVFTLLPNKKDQKYFDDLFGSLNLALRSAALGDEDGMSAALDLFVGMSDDEMNEGEYYAEYMDGLIAELGVFEPGELENEVFLFLMKERFREVEVERQVEFLSLLMENVYEALENGDEEEVAKALMDDYFTYYGDFVGGVDADFGLGKFLEEQDAVLYNLLIQDSLFYKDSFFAAKDLVEGDLLAQIKGKSLELEFKQSLIGEKIDLLKRLRYFFFEEKVEIVDAKDIYKRLMNEVKLLLPDANVGGAAVVELFNEQLSDVEDFWGYLTSPAYHSVGAGYSHKDRYSEYLKDRQTVTGVEELREEVFGEVVEEELSVFEVQAEIEAVFEEVDGLGDLEIGEIEDTSDRYVPLSAVAGGYPFEARYDRYSQNVENVYVYEELVSDRAVPLVNLIPLFQERFAELSDDFAEEFEEVTVESVAQRSARLFLAEKLSELGFVVGIENVSVFDEDNALYRVERVLLASDEGGVVEVTFDIDMTKEEAMNVYLNVKGDLKVVDGSYAFEDLVLLVQGEIDFLNKPVVTGEPGVVRR